MCRRNRRQRSSGSSFQLTNPEASSTLQLFGKYLDTYSICARRHALRRAPRHRSPAEWRQVTEFLWALAVVGAVLLAIGLAFALDRTSEASQGSGSSVAHDSDETAYDRDNRQRLNPVAILVFAVLIGGIVALVLVLSLT